MLTITLPTQRIIDLFGPPPEGVRVALWDQLTEDLPHGIDPEDVDIVLAADMPTVRPFERIASAAPNVRLLQLFTAGYDHVTGLFGPDVTIANGRGIHSDETAELAISLALGNLRGIDIFARRMTTGYWQDSITKRPTMTGRKALVVGAGSIASEIVGRLRGLKADVTVVARTSRESEIGHIHGINELPELLPQAECLFLSIPLTAATDHLIGAHELSLLPDDSLVVNVARGRVVDTEALMLELEKGRLRAALDVTDPEPLPADHPLWHLPGVLISPHCGGDTPLSDVRGRADASAGGGLPAGHGPGECRCGSAECAVDFRDRRELSTVAATTDREQPTVLKPSAPLYKQIEAIPGLSDFGSETARTPEQDASALLERHWGVSGELVRQRTEKDDTFVVRSEPKLLLKIANANERRVVTDVQVEALRHLERVYPRLPVPMVRPTLERELVVEDAAGGVGRVRAIVLSYLPGQPMPGNGEEQARPELLHDIGRNLGRLTEGLSAFSHPGARRPDLVWDLRRLPEMSPLIDLIGDEDQKRLVETCIADVLPILNAVGESPEQVCHNDFHPGNLLVAGPGSDRLTGILDFGDILLTQPICDLATCLTYFATEASPSLEPVKSVLKGYRSIRAVSRDEGSVLVELMRARAALCLLVPRWKALRRPREAKYELRKISHHARLLARLSQMSQRQRATALRN